MRVLNWFLAIIAACAIAITIATIYHLRYRSVGEGGVYDSWRSRACYPDTCVTYGPPAFPPEDTAAFEAWKRARPPAQMDTGMKADSLNNPFADLIPKKRR